MSEIDFVPGRYRLVIPPQQRNPRHATCWFDAENKEECAAKVRSIFWCENISQIEVARMQEQPYLQRAVLRPDEKLIPSTHLPFARWETVGDWDVFGFVLGFGAGL